ncbi:MAG TPA: hypothetical protein VGO93_04665 [Candidatus Xenobia bacterium]
MTLAPGTYYLTLSAPCNPNCILCSWSNVCGASTSQSFTLLDGVGADTGPQPPNSFSILGATAPELDAHATALPAAIVAVLFALVSDGRRR